MKEKIMKKQRFCKICGKDITDMSGNAVYCGYSCRIKNAGNKKCEGKELVKCAICGLERRSLGGHIRRTHKISLTEYMEKYDKIMDDVIPKLVRDKIGEKVKGENNGAYGHGGKYSPYSKKFVKYETLSEEEKYEKIEKLNKQHGQTHIKNQKSSNQIGYWIRLGYTEDEAIQKVSDRQKTFTKEKCIERYGEEAGMKRWKERQSKWMDNYKKSNYSLVSQKLFWEIYETIKNDFTEIFFAQLDNKEKDLSGKNHEYKIDIGDSYCKADFFIKDTNKCIEFDGDYWHGESRGNQNRDALRNEQLENMGYNLLHVQERDYKENPQKIIQECLNFIHG